MSATAITDVDVKARKDTNEAVRNERILGEVTLTVDGAWDGGSRPKVETGTLVRSGIPDASRSGNFTIESDEPSALLQGHRRLPCEHLVQALAGCDTVTLAAKAAARGIELDRYRLHMESDFDLSGSFASTPARRPARRRSAPVSNSKLPALPVRSWRSWLTWSRLVLRSAT